MRFFIAALLVSLFCVTNLNAKDDFEVEQRPLIQPRGEKPIEGTFLRCRTGKKRIDNRDSAYLYIYLTDGRCRIFDKSNLELLAVTPKAEFVHANRKGFFVGQGEGFWTKSKMAFYTWKNQVVWSKTASWMLLSEASDIILTLKNPTQYGLIQGDVIAYELSTGNLLWTNTFPMHTHYGWIDSYLNLRHEVGRYIIGDSLYHLNIKTGEKHSYPFKATVGESAKSFFSVCTKEVFPSAEWRIEADCVMTQWGLLGGTHSNFLQSGDSLFVADADSIYCFDSILNLIWATPFPEGYGSKSHLERDGNRLLLQNFGVGFQNGYIGKSGKPFMATYDCQTGQQLSFYEPTMKKKLRGGKFVPGRVYWQDYDNFYYTNEGENDTKKMDWTPKTSFQPDQTVPNHVIYDSIGVLKDGKLDFIYTDDHQVIVELYDRDVNIIDDEGNMTYLSYNRAFFNDGYELYSNNADGRVRQYLLVDPESHDVKMFFHADGHVRQGKKGDLWIFMSDGVGVIRKEQLQKYYSKSPSKEKDRKTEP